MGVQTCLGKILQCACLNAAPAEVCSPSCHELVESTLELLSSGYSTHLCSNASLPLFLVVVLLVPLAWLHRTLVVLSVNCLRTRLKGVVQTTCKRD